MATILILSFTGRVAVNAINSSKLVHEVIKENGNKSEKAEANEDNEQTEEKIKLEDLITFGFTKIDFLSVASAKINLFPGDYQLVNCDLQTPEYPPK